MHNQNRRNMNPEFEFDDEIRCMSEWSHLTGGGELLIVSAGNVGITS